MQDYFKSITEHLPAIVAGGLGGLVRWLSLKESTRDGLTSIVVGAITAVYAGPVATSLLNPVTRHVIENSAARERLGGFLVGCGGILVVGYFIDRWRSLHRKCGGDDNASK